MALVDRLKINLSILIDIGDRGKQFVRNLTKGHLAFGLSLMCKFLAFLTLWLFANFKPLHSCCPDPWNLCIPRPMGRKFVNVPR